jgi:Uma2 family endonuclease
MHALVFESVETVDQRQFSAFAADRERQGDRSQYELLNGRVVMNPPAGYPHGEIGSNVQYAIGGFVRARGLGRMFDSSQGFELDSGDTVEPDHSFVSTERWASAPAPVEGEYLRVTPDWVAEILSTRTASRDRGEKKAIYERNAVREYWLVDPRSRQVTVYVLRDGRFDAGSIHAEEDQVRSEVFAGLELVVRDLMPA